MKQTVTATSTNHTELLAFHEAAREFVWLRTMEEIVIQQCGIKTKDQPTTIFKDNSTCIIHMSSGFSKADRTKHISPHIFGYTQDLVKKGHLKIRLVELKHNIADMLTKAFPAYKHKKLVYATGMRTLQKLNSLDD